MSARGSLVAVVLLIVTLWATVVAGRPPAPLPADAPVDVFSGGRAMTRLRALLGDGSPHPTGTPANAAFRARLRTQLTELGIPVEEQRAFVCDPTSGRCAPVVNIVARIPGQQDGRAVMLAAHHDSVAAAPGAGDDGQGVAVALEVARALLAPGSAPPRNPVVLLFTDGEELGLFGARAFVEHHRWAQDIAVALNVEARGSCGLSRMFETSTGNAWLLDAYASRVSSPSASSLSYEVYRRMPNGSDLTVFREHGMAGLNFAFIAGEGHYHTARDDLEHLCPGSVQHQGEQVLAAARALVAMDLPHEPSSLTGGDDAIYTDLFTRWLIRWPRRWATPVATLVVLALGLLLGRALRRRVVRGRDVPVALAAFVLLIVSVLALGLLVAAMITTLSASSRPWYANPQPTRLALWGASALAMAPALAVARRAGALALALVTWLLWALAGLLCSVVIPGVSVIFVLPAAVAALGMALADRVSSRTYEAVMLSLGPCVALAVWAPLTYGIELAFGLGAPTAMLALLALTLSVVAPTLVRDAGRRERPLWIALAVVTVGLALHASRQPEYTRAVPQPLNVVLHEDRARGEARWIAHAWGGGDTLPASLAALASFERGPIAAPPWNGRLVFSATAETTAEPGPALTVIDTQLVDAAARRVRLRVGERDGRGPGMVTVLVPRSALAEDARVDITVEGSGADDPVRARPGTRTRDHATITLFGLPPTGAELQLTLHRDPVTITVLAASYGAPTSATPLVTARDASATPRQHGDMHIIAAEHTI